jgi:hypothetical protein
LEAFKRTRPQFRRKKWPPPHRNIGAAGERFKIIDDARHVTDAEKFSMEIPGQFSVEIDIPSLRARILAPLR